MAVRGHGGHLLPLLTFALDTHPALEVCALRRPVRGLRERHCCFRSTTIGRLLDRAGVTLTSRRSRSVFGIQSALCLGVLWLKEWGGFAMVAGGAAAALLGLLFVAVSIRVNVIAGSAELRNRAAQTGVLFLTVVLATLLLDVPQQQRAGRRVFGADRRNGRSAPPTRPTRSGRVGVRAHRTGHRRR